jgi:nucleoside-diphosphate-sugar epimerase
MRIVVTGASGFVGAQVVRALTRAGDEVHAVVRPTSDRRRLVKVPDLKLLEADMLTEEGRERIAAVGAEACVHAAWVAEPGKYLASLANVDLMGATLSLAITLARHGCRRVVGIGTCFEYDTNTGYLSEETPLAPAHLYSAAKAGTYLALKQLGVVLGIEVAWARLFYLYGPDEHPRRLVPAIVCALLRGQEAQTTPGLQVRDFLHIEDVASAVGAIVHSDLVGAVNIGSGQPITVAAIVKQLGSVCGRADLVRLGALPYGPGDPMFICANVHKLVSGTGWQTRWPIAEGLADAVAWWRSVEGVDARRS